MEVSLRAEILAFIFYFYDREILVLWVQTNHLGSIALLSSEILTPLVISYYCGQMGGLILSDMGNNSLSIKRLSYYWNSK